MSESLSTWLALREAIDTAARSEPLTHAVAAELARKISMGGAGSSPRPLRVLDLATGTGSNIRYLASRLPSPQHWLLVDQDAGLLEEVPARMSAWGASRGYRTAVAPDGLSLYGESFECHVATERRQLDVLDDPSIFSGRDLVTASALLDLVSESWLDALAARCRESGSAVLFALSYDGRSRCLPSEPEDEHVRALFNRHQRANDKGFGVAAGPDATARAERSFSAAGFTVKRAVSDWVLPPDAQSLQRSLIEGWAEAATEVAPQDTATIQAWLTRRLAHVEAQRSRIVVGHEDLAGWLD